jgi:hypothetical protein
MNPIGSAEKIDCWHPKVPERHNQAGIVSPVPAGTCVGK